MGERHVRYWRDSATENRLGDTLTGIAAERHQLRRAFLDGIVARYELRDGEILALAEEATAYCVDSIYLRGAYPCHFPANDNISTWPFYSS